MTYFKDLSPYTYLKGVEVNASVLNVGWLSRSESFEAEETSLEFKKRLNNLCASQNLVLLTRGFHVCEFCSDKYRELMRLHLDWDHGRELRGNGEIRVIGNSVIYAAPALIYHYVVEHQYRPPHEFIDAVLTGP